VVKDHCIARDLLLGFQEQAAGEVFEVDDGRIAASGNSRIVNGLIGCT